MRMISTKSCLKKWNEYLYKLKSGQHLTEMIGHALKNTTDIREHMEEIRICLRGHNLYDIFYGRFRKNETEILKSYIEEAPRVLLKIFWMQLTVLFILEQKKIIHEEGCHAWHPLFIRKRSLLFP